MLNRIWLFLKKDPLRRLVALGFAVSIYLYLHFEITGNDRHLSIKAPVTLSLESGLQPPQEQPQVTIDLKTKDTSDIDIDKLASKTRVFVTVRKQNRRKDGTYEVRVSPRDVELPDSRLEANKIISPAGGVLKLALLRQDERDVSVEPTWDGAVPPGMELKWEAFPDQVRITGAENVISKLQKVYTTPISLADPPEFFEYDPGLNLPQGVTAAPRKVRFRVKLLRKFGRRSMLRPVSVLVSPGNSPSAVAAFLPPGDIEVNLRGPAAKLADLPPDRVRLFVDATGISAPGRRRLPVRCHVSVPEIVPVSIVPAELEVQFTRNTSEINKKRKEK